jgi:uncharacterized protein (DUF427 family)
LCSRREQLLLSPGVFKNGISVCFWKGKASYFDVEVDGEVNKDAAWYYPSPKEDASKIKDYVAFWKGVEVH